MSNEVMQQKCAIKLDFRDAELRTRLEPVCQRVFEHLELPSLRLYCLFDNHDDVSLSQLGKYYRGFHTDRCRGRSLADHLRNLFYLSPEEIDRVTRSRVITFEETIAFDNMVYIRNTSCDDVTGFTTTLAHELQHFRQYGFARKVADANLILYYNICAFDRYTRWSPIDIPCERDANVVSKRVAEVVCGAAAVEAFADERIRKFTELGSRGNDQSAIDEATRWKFFRDVPASTDFDLLEATKPMVRQFRSELISGDFGREFGIDFRKEEWWE